MTYHVTHVTVSEAPPPWVNQKQVLGVIRDISPRREKRAEEAFDRVRLEVDEEAEVEAKVVNPRRTRRPKPSEVAETK